MKKITVEQDYCIGCGACVSIDGADFQFDENGLSKEVNKTVEDNNELAVTAMEACPTGAIKIEDAEEIE